MPMDRVYHLRSKFYNDSFFTPMPSLEDDAQPFADLVEQLQPSIVTVAFDPEGLFFLFIFFEIQKNNRPFLKYYNTI